MRKQKEGCRKLCGNKRKVVGSYVAEKGKEGRRLGKGCEAILLKGLSHEIFTVIFWLEWIYIGLKGNRFWFLNIKDVSLILDSNFKY